MSWIAPIPLDLATEVGTQEAENATIRIYSIPTVAANYRPQ